MSSLGGMLAGAAGIGTADAACDVDGFVRKSAELSEVAGRAVTAINAAFATDEQLAAIAAVAEPKERQARYAALCAAESAETRRLLDSGEMERCMVQLDSDKKKLIGQALLNFAIGSLQAVEQGKHGHALVQQAGISPLELVRILPVKDAIPFSKTYAKLTVVNFCRWVPASRGPVSPHAHARGQSHSLHRQLRWNSSPNSSS